MGSHRHQKSSEDSTSREVKRAHGERKESGGHFHGKSSQKTGRDRSRTPTRHRSRSPRRRRSRSTSKRRSISPVRRRSKSPVRRRSKSPSRISEGSSLYGSSSFTPSDRDPRTFKAKDVVVPDDYICSDDARLRCKLTEPEMEKFMSFARGTVTEPKERDKWISALPIVDHISATPPHLQKSLRSGDLKYLLSEGQAIDMQSSLYAALNLLAISDAQGVEDEDRVNFRARCMRVISMLIQQLTTIRRAMAVDSLKIDKKVIGAFGGRSLDLKEADNPSREGQKVHWLFAKDMEDELLAEVKKKEKEAEKKKSVSFFIPFGQWDIENDLLNSQLSFYVPAPVWEEITAPMTAGRLKYFASNWSKITNDTFVLEAIRGYKLPFRGGKIPKQSQNYHYHDASNPEIKAEIISLLEKDAIEECKTADWLSTVFSVPKKDGGMRPVINLRGLNEFMVTPHFKMESLLLVKDLLEENYYMVKLDLKDAYFGIPIAVEHRPYLAFRAFGKTYRFKALPFGLAPAPSVYTRVIKPVAAFFRARGILLIVYLDDWFFLAKTKQKLLVDLGFVRATFMALGLMINESKSQLIPTRQIEFLGLQVDSSSMTLSVPAEKQNRIGKVARQILATPFVSAAILSKLCGSLASIKLASNYSSLKARFLQRMLKSVDNSKDLENQKIALTAEAKEEAKFWASNNPIAFIKDLKPPPVSISIKTDASLEGWGFYCGDISSGGRWNKTEKKLHINALELKAVFLSLKTACKDCFNTSIRIESDNITTVAFINRRGGTRSRSLQKVAHELWMWALERRLFLIASHIPGVSNIEADLESRRFKECCEWSLASQTVKILFDKWGIPEVDLFASRLNHKCDRYFSFNPDPNAEGTDAFAHNWKDFNAYAFPPFNLVGRTIQKARADKANLILVTPAWLSAPYWPQLQDLADGPLLLSGFSLRDPISNQVHYLAQAKRLNLAAWKISFRYGLH
uniref:Reverse transcriptase domain-containing protein n=1 Tax=Panagrolaimus superbus TaxID=310955 RepID=A0A914YL49_9BILA